MFRKLFFGSIRWPRHTKRDAVAAAILVFLLTPFPLLLAPAPRVDFIFANNAISSSDIKITVEGNHVVVAFLGHMAGNPRPKLYRYYAASQSVKEIPITVPETVLETYKEHEKLYAGTITSERPSIPIVIDEIERLEVTHTSDTAFDGYIFRSGEQYGYNILEILENLFFSIGFFSHKHVLVKDHKIIEIPNTAYGAWASLGQTGYASGYDTLFLGWLGGDRLENIREEEEYNRRMNRMLKKRKLEN